MQRLPRAWIESDPFWPLYRDFRLIARKYLNDRGDSDTGEDAVDQFIFRDGFHAFGKLRKLCFRDISTRHII